LTALDINMFYVRNITGQRVKQARLAKQPRMTQANLAAKLQLDSWDIDRVGIAKIEIGLRQVTDIEVLKLARALDVDITYLFGEHLR
jgi:HTH-type transcriptional regulator, cell division transcriptional repressor